MQVPFSCLARLAHCLLWLLSCCCSTDPHKYRTPKSQMSNYGSEVSSIYRKPMLGTQRDVTADKTSFDNNGLLVLVYNRTKTKSKDQVSKKTLRAQHLCGSGGKSRARFTHKSGPNVPGVPGTSRVCPWDASGASDRQIPLCDFSLSVFFSVPIFSRFTQSFSRFIRDINGEKNLVIDDQPRNHPHHHFGS